MSLLQPAPMPPAEGSLRDQLIAVVEGWAEAIAEVPAMLTAIDLAGLGPDAGDYSEVRQADSDAAGHRCGRGSSSCTPRRSMPSSTVRRPRPNSR